MSALEPLKGEETFIRIVGCGIPLETVPFDLVELFVLYPCDVLFLELLKVPVLVELCRRNMLDLVDSSRLSIKLPPFYTFVKVCLDSCMAPWSCTLLMFLFNLNGMLSFSLSVDALEP